MRYDPLNPVPAWAGYHGMNTAIPNLYWNEYTAEQRIRCICEELYNLECYASDLGIQTNLNIDTINQLGELLEQLQNGGWFEEYEDIIKAWIEDIHNLTEIIQQEIAAVIAPIQSEIKQEFEAQNTRIDTFDNRITANTTRNAQDLEFNRSDNYGLKFVAHRGAMFTAPENTVQAFARAGEFMYDAIEFDIHATADGEIVCLHDSQISTYTNGTGLVEALSLDTVKQYPITKGDWKTYADGFCTEQYIPTLSEALDEIQKWPFKAIFCEFKGETQWTRELYTKVFNEFKGRGLLGRLIVTSFGRSVLLNVQAINENIPTCIILGTPSRTQIDVEHNYGIDMISMPYEAGKDVHTYAHSLGMRTNVYSLGADNSVYNAMDFGAEFLTINTLGHITRTTTDIRMSPYGKMNLFGGATYPAFCKYARVQGDSNGFLPGNLSPYQADTITEETYGIGDSPAWRGQAARMSTPVIWLAPGTLVRWRGLNRYDIGLRIFAEDFNSYYDPDEWITSDSTFGIVPNATNNEQRGVPVVFTARRKTNTVLTELDAKILSGCLDISNAVGTLKFGSIYGGVTAGYSYRLQQNKGRLMSALVPTVNGAQIPIPNTTLTEVAIYIFNAQGKRVVDTGAQTPGSTYTVQNANAAYFRYVLLLKADSTKPITPLAYAEACTAFGLIG